MANEEQTEKENRFKRPGGPGSPGASSPSPNQEVASVDMQDAESVRLQDLQDIQTENSGNSGETPPRGESAEQDKKQSTPIQKLYNLELVIYTVSGHKYSARLNFKDDVEQGKMDHDRALKLLNKVESDLRNRTFQRPITYSEGKGNGPSVEYIFNPDNVECVSIIRKH